MNLRTLAQTQTKPALIERAHLQWSDAGFGRRRQIEMP